MLLTIDVGNTNIVYGLFEGTKLLHQFRVESTRGRTADEFAVTLRALLSMHDLSPKDVHAAIVASVVPSLTEPMAALVKRAFGIDALIVGPGIKSGMPILYENPREVGADRIVNAVAAYERVPKASKGTSGVIVVDFGTATTFDCISPKGEYLGGVICPGIQISADALFARAAKLPRVEIAKPPKAVGRNTIHSMQSGIVFGYVGLVDGLVERLASELGVPCHVIATGGLATLIAPLTKTIVDVDDVLTLEGLRLLYERNVG
ncbi:MAG: type III pantothenate kinase [Polyangiaceae bacterium]